ncbi:F0F1 ATP synthase subunit alpha [Candidatus Roizmanbacteria bacterium CG10_big_fil_rev_8_21_14_0_10_45_7]|uniref:ATP synthase subunit alpha n=1 Tax=Candidatus Roizmanbacteria bacterium CG10_big_fil_rev_8_21_14_0_10_45_7 TaxID=1974854 RepID=A0A2M8KUG9_9BACT|nr:MAG: F0F1 ATP synthase subunit alpha [Candidatus Roizmanbacteria bacterium CG10_big_fil_rev_8_21_14_0_10_45_7]
MAQKASLADNLIKDIESVKSPVVGGQSGEIIELYDGVAVVEGLPNARYGEMATLGNNHVGMITDLKEFQVAVLLFDDYTQLRVGDRVTINGTILSIPVSEKLLGRVVNPLGAPIDGQGALPTKEREEIEKIAPGIVHRKQVSVPLQTGIKSIDGLIPIGRGQRELIIGDRSTGKTTIAIDTILNQKHEQVICVYVAIGQKESKVAQVVNLLSEAGAMAYTIVVNASANDPGSLQYIAPYAGSAIAEYFMNKGKDVLIIYDDLTKHAWAYRQISLILRRPAGREAYPGDVFYLHSRLLERSCRLSPEKGGGSITALPIIETQEGDIAAYIPTNVISITDGQIFLEKDLFNAGMRPAINVGASVSRVGSSAQVKAMKQVAGQLKLELAQYRELAAFSQFASELDEETKKTLDRGARMYELLKQGKNKPLTLSEQVVTMWFGVRGYTKDIPVTAISQFEAEALEYVKAKHFALLEVIAKEKIVSEKIETELHKIAKKFITYFFVKRHEPSAAKEKN